MRIQTFIDKLGSGGEDCPVLGLGDERVGHMETYSAVTHHRVDLVEGFASLLDFADGDTELICKFFLLVLGLRNELVERRVEKAEDYRLAVHDLHCALHCGLDERLEFGESALPFLVSVAEDHLAEFGKRKLGVGTVEHVLYTEETDAFRTEAQGLLGILRSVGIGSDAEFAELVDSGHELDEERILGSVHCRDLLAVDETLCAVETHPVTLLEDDVTE